MNKSIVIRPQINNPHTAQKFIAPVSQQSKQDFAQLQQGRSKNTGKLQNTTSNTGVIFNSPHAFVRAHHFVPESVVQQRTIMQNILAINSNGPVERSAADLSYQLSTEQQHMLDLLLNGYSLAKAIEQLNLSVVVANARVVSILAVLNSEIFDGQIHMDKQVNNTSAIQQGRLHQSVFKAERGLQLTKDQQQCLEQLTKAFINRLKLECQHCKFTDSYDANQLKHVDVIPNTIREKLEADYSLEKLLKLFGASPLVSRLSTRHQQILAQWLMAGGFAAKAANSDINARQISYALQQIRQTLEVDSKKELHQILSKTFNWPIYPVPHTMQKKAADIVPVYIALATHASIIDAFSTHIQLELLAYLVADYSQTDVGKLLYLDTSTIATHLNSLSKKLHPTTKPPAPQTLALDFQKQLGLSRFKPPGNTPEPVAKRFNVLSENEKLTAVPITRKQLLAISYRFSGYTIDATAAHMGISPSQVKQLSQSLVRTLALGSTEALRQYINNDILRQFHLESMPKVVKRTFDILENNEWIRTQGISEEGRLVLSYWMTGFSSTLTASHMLIMPKSVTRLLHNAMKALQFYDLYALRTYLSLEMKLPLYPIPNRLPDKVKPIYQQLATDSIFHKNPLSKISPTEFQSVAYLMAGYSVPEIASYLDLQNSNIREALENVAKKLNIDYNLLIQSPHSYLLLENLGE